MKIEKQLQDDHQMQLTVEVETELMEANKRRAARQLSQRGKIPGFRPGKAPYDVIVRYYGEGAILEQAMELLIDDIYPKVLEEAKIEPAAPGSLEKIESMDPPKLIFRVPLSPEVELGNYRSLRLPYEWSAPGEEELENVLTNLRQKYATTETVDRPIEASDFVLCDVNGALIEAQNGDDLSESLSRTGFALVIHQEASKEEWPYPGFSKELIGLKAGESKTIKHKFAKETPNEALRGKTATFEVTVKIVRSMTLPDLDDDFARMVGEFENLEQLKAQLGDEIEMRSQEEYDEQYYDNLLAQIRQGAIIKYPPQLVEKEIEQMLDRLRRRLESQGIDLETYLKIINTDEQTFKEEQVKPIAIESLERDLLLDKVIKAEDIQIDEASWQQEMNQILFELVSQGFDMNKIEGGKQGRKKVTEAIGMQAFDRLLTVRALERLKAIATGQLEQEQAEDKKKPKKASTGKRSAKTAQTQLEDEEKAPETEAGASTEQEPQSSS